MSGSRRNPRAAAFGERLRKHRKRKGWTQATLAEKSGLKSADTISSYERGTRMPREESVTFMAEALGIEFTELMEGLPDDGQPTRNGQQSHPPDSDSSAVAAARRAYLEAILEEQWSRQTLALS